MGKKRSAEARDAGEASSEEAVAVEDAAGSGEDEVGRAARVAPGAGGNEYEKKILTGVIRRLKAIRSDPSVLEPKKKKKGAAGEDSAAFLEDHVADADPSAWTTVEAAHEAYTKWSLFTGVAKRPDSLATFKKNLKAKFGDCMVQRTFIKGYRISAPPGPRMDEILGEDGVADRRPSEVPPDPEDAVDVA